MTGEDSLRRAVSDYAGELSDTFEAVLGGSHPFEVQVGPPGDDQRITIDQQDPDGIALTVAGQLRLRLQVRFRCSWNSDRAFMAVTSSEFKLLVDGVAEPLMHYDYSHSGPENVPVAHLNIHAHRDELTVALMLAEGHRAKSRQKALEKGGRLPRLSALHLPVGGHRFRPSIEDILQMLIVEFGVDCTSKAFSALDRGRQRYRAMQLSAAVGDDPEVAATELRRQGYSVAGPAEPPARRERSDRY